MKTLFVYMVFFLTFSQVMSNSVITGENTMLSVEDQNIPQDSNNNASLDDDDNEIEFIATSCSPTYFLIDRGETIFMDENRVKSLFYFSMWRPPRF